MAQAAEQHTPTYNWSLDEAFRHLTRSVRLSQSDALYEMEQLPVEVQKYIDGKPQGEPLYRHKDFRLVVRVVRGHRWVVLEGLEGSDSRCRVAEQDVRAIRAPSTPGAPLPPSPKPITPSKKRKRPRPRDRLISLMKDLDLKPGMLPHEVLRAVKQPYKDKYHDEPSQSSATRAYDEYEGALTNSGDDLRGMPADLSKFYPATPTHEWLNPAVD